jgi:hypothetical protein
VAGFSFGSGLVTSSRAAALMGFLDYIMNHVRVWVPTRLQIAQHWHANLAYLAANASSVR